MVVNENTWSRWLVRMVGSGLVVAIVVSALTTGVVDSASARKRESANPKLVQDFSNTTAIAINDSGQSAPSSIAVSGFDTEVADVNVTLHNLSHGFSADIDMLLVGPGGQTAYLLSDLGNGANNVTLALDDQAPNQVSSFNPLTSGSFQPANFGTFADGFSPPGPTTPSSGSELGVFNSTDPNGTWTLFIRDDNPGQTGVLNSGWSLRITSANGVPNAAPDTFSAHAGKTLSESTGVLANDGDPDDDSLTAILAGTPAKGRVQLAPDGSFTYKSSKKAKGKDSFTYLAQDPGGLSDLETVNIQIKKAKKKGKGKK